MADILVAEGLTAGYGAAVAIEDLSLALPEGGSLAVLGRNGTGKSTLIKTIVGLTTRFRGGIQLAGRDIVRLPPERRAAMGIGWVPQERGIFRSLTVEENLSAVSRRGPWTMPRVFGLFPRLADRRKNRGTTLSGGEQQMLAIGRALVLNPKVILLDEPLEGLAPIVSEEVLAALHRIRGEEGVATVIVEQKARKALSIADHAIILERGRIVFQGPRADLLADPLVLEGYIGSLRRSAPKGGAASDTPSLSR